MRKKFFFQMKSFEYRNMYYAISKGIEIGVSAESVLKETVAQRKRSGFTSKEYNDLIIFFTECDKITGAHIVSDNLALQTQIERGLPGI